MQAGDYDNTVEGRDLIGTSDGGLNFDVSDYDRFLIYVPAGTDRVFLDAVGFQNGSQPWLDSIEGDEYMHRGEDFEPYSANPDCSWDGGCVMGDGEGYQYTTVGEDYVERAPDRYAIASNPEYDSYYQYSTFGADSMRLYLTYNPIE